MRNNNITHPGIPSLNKGRRLQKNGFTLVELIVVITILAILGTIAFISLQGYSAQSRDSVRLTDMKNIELGLEIFSVETGKYPIPDEKVAITASGVPISYQGTAGENVLGMIEVHGGGKDPIEESYYTYMVDVNKTSYQLLGFLEDEDIALGSLEVNAGDLTKRFPVSKGDELGIILDATTNAPVKVPVDVATTIDEYKAVLSTENTVTGSGNDLFSGIYNGSETFLKNKDLASLDDSLIGYWDMETTTFSGAITVLKDLSSYGGNATLSGTVFTDGKSGKSIRFESGYHGVIVPGFNTYTPQKEISIAFWVNLNTINSSDIISLNPLEGAGTDRINIHFPWYGTYPGKLYWQFATDGANISASSEVNTPDNLINQWNHFIFTTSISGGYSRIYQNGKQITTWPASGIHNNFSADLIVGDIDGMIDELRIYNRALSETEIKKLYDSSVN